MTLCENLRALGWAALLLPAAALAAEVRLIAFGEIPASSVDALGDTLGGIGSAVAYDPRTGDVLLMPDRGAGDGTIDYQPRYHRVRLQRLGDRLTARVVSTTLFRDERGRPFTGLSPDREDRTTHCERLCLDPEALAIAPDGSLYVGDEYRPAILHFRRDGRLLRVLPLPSWYAPHDAAGRPAYLPHAAITSGRTENQGIEALGLLPDGRHAVVILQSGLAQDGGRGAGISRVLILDLASGAPVAEYAYRFTRPWGASFRELSVNDLAVLDEHTLLVLERDGLGRDGNPSAAPARTKAVYRVDLRGATNLLALPGHRLPARGLRPVKKTRVFNLPDLLAKNKIPRSTLAAKWEGLALLPSADAHEQRLLLTADNDFLAPNLRLDGRVVPFPCAQDAVPTQLVEVLLRN